MIIEIPDSLSYPKILPLQEIHEIRGKLCYVFKAYSLEGYSCVIVREKGNICVRFSDWNGNILDLSKQHDLSPNFGESVIKLATLMRYIRVDRLQAYFSGKDKVMLVDIRLTFNKFISPGMLNDLIGKLGIEVPEVIGRPIGLDDANISKLLSKSGEYSGTIIVKPSVFKSIVRGEEILPAYGLVQ
jgi:hypothetical protein